MPHLPPTMLLRAAATWVVSGSLAMGPSAAALTPAGSPPHRVTAEAAAAIPSPRSETRPFVAGELLVRFRPSATPSARASVRARHRLQKVRDLPLPGLELVRTSGRPIPKRAREVAMERAVRIAEPNYLWRPAQVPPPNDPEFSALWGLHNTGQTGGTPGRDIGALAGWELAGNSREVVVGVIDTGVWTDHPDLRDAIWLNRGELPPPDGSHCAPPPGDPHDCDGDGAFTAADYEGDSRVDGPGLPRPDRIRVAFQDGHDEDGNGHVDDILGWDFAGDDNTVFDKLDGDDHGTHVAGTIAAASDNGIGVAGVSAARIMPIKFLGPQGGTTADGILALDYAIRMGAHITNNSWGGIGDSTLLKSKIAQADAAGQLFVAAAGNGDATGNGVNNDATPFYPASFPNPNIVAVAATTHTDGLASFSNYGATSVDLGAPGVSILSTVPRFSKAVLRPRSGPTGAVAFHTFGLEGVAAASDRQGLLGAALAWMEVEPSDPILLVDDDGGAGFQSVYQDALTTLGFTSLTTHSVGAPNTPCNRHGPTAAEMAGIRAVIWLTGATFRCTLTSTDQSNITSYVTGQTGSSPRNLLLFGQDIGYDLTADGTQQSAFMTDTLGADFVADYDHNFRLSGVAGSPYEEVPDFGIAAHAPTASPPGGQAFSSAIAPKAGAMSGLRGADTTWFDGTSMAAPHVAGALVHLLAKHPGLGHLEAKARVLDRGDPAPALAGKTASGKRLSLVRALAGPAAPTNVTAEPRRYGAIEISWDPSPGADVTGYRVHRGNGPGFVPGPGNVVSGPDPLDGGPFLDTGAVHGTTYHYAVRAWDASGFESVSSAKASATADAAPPTDVRVTAPAARYQRQRAIRAAWSAEDPESGVAEYRVQSRSRRWNGRGSGGWVLWTATGEDRGTFAGRPGETRCFRVRATDGVGHLSTWSAPACTAVPLNDGAFRRQGPWRRVTGRQGHYLESFVRTNAPGASLRRTGIRGATHASLIYTSCPRCGAVEIRWRGKPVLRLAMRSSQRRPLRVRAIPGVSGRGRLEVVVVSRNRPVFIEGLGITVDP